MVQGKKGLTFQNCVQSAANLIKEQLPSQPSVTRWLGRTISSWPSWAAQAAFATLQFFNIDAQEHLAEAIREALPITDVLQDVVIGYYQLHHTEVEQIIRDEMKHLYPPFSFELQKKLDAIKASRAEQLDLQGLSFHFVQQDGYKFVMAHRQPLKRLETIVSVLPHLKTLKLAKATIGSISWEHYIKIIAEKLHRLEILDLSNTTVGDECVTMLAQLKHLKRLVICQVSHLTAEGKARLVQALPNLEIVDLYPNKLKN